MSSAAADVVTVHRIEVFPKPGMPDPKGAAACREAQSLGLSAGGGSPQKIDSANIYLLEGPIDAQDVKRLATELLADPVTEQAVIGASPRKADALIEVHPLPGVMDPDADAVQLAIKAMLGADVQVRTGRRYDMHGTSQPAARDIAERCLANTVIHAIHEQAYHPNEFPAGRPYELKIVTVPLRDLDDAALIKMSRDAHLFLSLDEMKAIQSEYRRLGRDPREIELETIAQTWSEHCVHKTLKAHIRYRETPSANGSSAEATVIPGLSVPDAVKRPGHERNADGSVTIHNLLKSTVAAATFELMKDGIDWCLSVFVDNAGVIAFDDKHAVCFKCETHNHPSAIEPYGGAATGIGGCIRDIMGTGLSAKPIAATDVFCVAFPDHFGVGASSETGLNTEVTEDGTENTEKRYGLEAGSSDEMRASFRRSNHQNQKHSPQNPSSAFSVPSSVPSVVKSVPRGVLHPRRVLSQVVAGVRDYGNRMGIPTLNGAVWFDDNYIGNPLVYCGVIGVMPRDMIKGVVKRGDRIIALGGRTGRDGIHGATFSSAELTDTHADEFSHAVQIGNAITQKKMMDAILEARDHESGCLFNGITDCGAGGFSSAVGEMGKDVGATVDLDRAPLKYEGLSATEIWISEAQERMVLSVSPGKCDALRAICARHDVELCDLGEFGTESSELVLRYQGTEVGRLAMHFLHDGLPETVREAVWTQASGVPQVQSSKQEVAQPSIEEALLALLSHPNIASKRWIIRQYDHEVQGRTVIKPLAGADADGPMDAAVVTPVPGSSRGLAIANGLATGWKDDPYLMTLAAIDECVRNLVCVGADSSRIAILDNFCWPSCNDPANLGSLVRAAEACYDGAKAYRTPFVSGKDSLNNQFTGEDGVTIRIPPTLLVSGMGIVPNVGRCVTMDAKQAGNLLLIVGETSGAMGGSHHQMLFGDGRGQSLPRVDLQQGPRTALAVSKVIAAGLARSAHDCSEGGLLVAAAEMAFAGGLGLHLDFTLMPTAAGGGDLGLMAECFAETPSRYLLEIPRADLDAADRLLKGVRYAIIGEFNASSRLTLAGGEMDVTIEDLHSAWTRTLDW